MIYLTDIVFASIVAGILTLIIELGRTARNLDRIPVLSEQFANQKYVYHIHSGDYSFTGYSDTEYTPAEITLYAVRQLGLTGRIVISMSKAENSE